MTTRSKNKLRFLIGIGVIAAIVFCVWVASVLERSRRGAYLSSLYESTRTLLGDPKAIDELKSMPQEDATDTLALIVRDSEVPSQIRESALTALQSRGFTRWESLYTVFDVGEALDFQEKAFAAIQRSQYCSEQCITMFVRVRKEWFDGKRPRALPLPKDEGAFQASLSANLQNRLREQDPNRRNRFNETFLKLEKENRQRQLTLNAQIDGYLASEPAARKLLISKFSESPEFVKAYLAVLEGKRDARFAY
jgi:hypothetical protein